MKLRFLTPVAAILLVAGCVEIDPSQINFGDDTSDWANDGECDDPRFEGPASATTLLPVDTGRDATDCRDLLAKGFITYVG